MLVFVLLGALIAVPIATSVGSATHANQLAKSDEQLASRHRSSAELLADAPSAEITADGTTSENAVVRAPAHWKAPGNIEKTGYIGVQPGSPAGKNVPVWLDNRGAVVPAPVLPLDAAVLGILVAVFVWLVSLAPLAVLYWWARWALDRRREDEWAREWERVNQDWTLY